MSIFKPRLIPSKDGMAHMAGSDGSFTAVRDAVKQAAAAGKAEAASLPAHLGGSSYVLPTEAPRDDLTVAQPSVTVEANVIRQPLGYRAAEMAAGVTGTAKRWGGAAVSGAKSIGSKTVDVAKTAVSAPMTLVRRDDGSWRWLRIAAVAVVALLLWTWWTGKAAKTSGGIVSRTWKKLKFWG